MIVKRQMNEAIEDYSSGKIDIARAKFENLILIDDKNLDLLYNYGRILGDLEEYEKEQRIYFRILELNPNDLETLINLSISLNATKNFHESIKVINKALLLNNKISQAFEARGVARLGIFDISGAVEDFKQWITLILEKEKIEKTELFLKSCIDLINLPPIYQKKQEIDKTRSEIERKTDYLCEILDRVPNSDLDIGKIGKKVAFKLKQFYLGYQQKNDREINEKTLKVIKKLLGNDGIDYKNRNIGVNAKKKLAIISTFQVHPKLFIFDQISKIDKSKYDVEVLVINNIKFANDFLSNYNCSHHIINPDNYSKKITEFKEKNFDIVFLPDIGVSIESRILSLEKLSPLMVTSWLHPITSGSDYIDIFLSGDLMEMEKNNEHYSEKVIALPGIGLKINPNDYLVITKEEIENKKNSEKFLVGCIQTPFKIHPRMDEIFVKLGKKITNSVFIFIKFQDELDELLINRIRKAFLINNLAPERIVLKERMEKNKYRNFLKELDITIDSLGWSGGNTTLDSIGAGLPTLTMRGDLMRANHTSGIYKLIGVEELIYENEDDLIEDAYKMSINNEKLITLRKKIIENFSKIQTDYYISNYFNSVYRA